MNFFHHISNSFRAVTPATSFVTTNLFAYYDATNPGATGWQDLHQAYNPSTYTYNMSNVNGAAFTTIGGVAALYLDGVNDYCFLQQRPKQLDDPLLNVNLLNYTYEFWIRSNGVWLGNGNFWAAGYNQASRSRWSSGVRIYAPNMDTFNLVYIPEATFTTNVWHHMVVTMENLGANDRLIVYRNAVQTGIDTTGNYNPTDLNGNDFFLGSFNGAGEFQRQYVGLCRRYNIALTAAQVTQNFNAEKARFGY